MTNFRKRRMKRERCSTKYTDKLHGDWSQCLLFPVVTDFIIYALHSTKNRLHSCFMPGQSGETTKVMFTEDRYKTSFYGLLSSPLQTSKLKGV